MNRSDGKMLTVVAIIAALLCLFAIPQPFSPYSWNVTLIQAIPAPVALLLLITACLLRYSLTISDLARFEERRREQFLIAKEKAQGKLVFKACFRENDDGGTIWRVSNRNSFPWTQCVILLEKDLHGEKKTEKYHLGLVHGKQNVEIESALTPASTAQWRVMAITDQGKVVDFPDTWTQKAMTPRPTELVS